VRTCPVLPLLSRSKFSFTSGNYKADVKSRSRLRNCKAAQFEIVVGQVTHILGDCESGKQTHNVRLWDTKAGAGR